MDNDLVLAVFYHGLNLVHGQDEIDDLLSEDVHSSEWLFAFYALLAMGDD